MVDDGAIVAQLDQVGMRYGAGAAVLDGIDLALPAGSFRFLLGPGGAGKTSLLRLLRLGASPSAGRLRLFGDDPGRLDRDGRARLRQRIGAVFQDLRLLDDLSAYDNVALRLRVAGVPEELVAARVAPLLGWLDLGEAIERRPCELAPPQRQLVALARAVVGDPGLILADEPLAGLDAAQAARAMRLLLSLQRHGAAVVLATRDEALHRRYPMTALHLAAGRLAAQAVLRPARSA